MRKPIALICHASKILLTIILNRLRNKVEEELSDCQAGYRKGRGTTDMLFILQLLLEKIRNTKNEAFITFIDYSKAFDSVDHHHLFSMIFSFLLLVRHHTIIPDFSINPVVFLSASRDPSSFTAREAPSGQV